ncbi:hypothetical protein [Mycolicibacterium sp. D5.8-2]|uniref:hypothetical protein n=1 Tax=Mycolicibacterium sp. D5.8-2 TaxID=3085903 RepID=UPI00298C713D|nr:hypothetical protein [Mycolicibacterium sp. D5.8-2]MDW5612079.1 hypothetical protein [Mycolicibacterium sp. D5.8-2]
MTLPDQIPDDPRGWLTFTAPLPDDLQRGEDSTQYADFHPEKVTWQYEAATGTDYFTRPATDTEKTLLGLLGYTVPGDLTTRVSFPSPLVRRRRWPALETQQEAS